MTLLFLLQYHIPFSRNLRRHFHAFTRENIDEFSLCGVLFFAVVEIENTLQISTLEDQEIVLRREEFDIVAPKRGIVVLDAVERRVKIFQRQLRKVNHILFKKLQRFFVGSLLT